MKSQQVKAAQKRQAKERTKQETEIMSKTAIRLYCFKRTAIAQSQNMLRFDFFKPVGNIFSIGITVEKILLFKTDDGLKNTHFGRFFSQSTFLSVYGTACLHWLTTDLFLHLNHNLQRLGIMCENQQQKNGIIGDCQRFLKEPDRQKHW